MKQFLTSAKSCSILHMLTYPLLLTFSLVSCEKAKQLISPDNEHNCVNQTKDYPSDVAVAWMKMQLKLMIFPAGFQAVEHSRLIAYSGITLYESVVPGMPAFSSLSGRLNQMPAMPSIVNGKAYHWPTSANAALAAMNRNLFPNAKVANKYSIDSLETTFNSIYQSEIDADEFQRSVEYGKSIAQVVFEWSKTDGSLTVNPPYVPPAGPGLWVPSPPALAAAAVPYWGNNRTLVSNSLNEAIPAAPIPYSETPGSAFYDMVKNVYQTSLTLTPDQKAMAIFWRDVPGYAPPGHWLSVVEQAVVQEKTPLDNAAIAYAKTGIYMFDALVAVWKAKYLYNLERPITYIRTLFHQPNWLPLVNTPNHPEYPAHGAVAFASAKALSDIFGDHFHFIDHTYDFLGYSARSFNSFEEAASEAVQSMLYGGTQYQPSLDASKWVGNKVADNIEKKLKFLK